MENADQLGAACTALDAPVDDPITMYPDPFVEMVPSAAKTRVVIRSAFCAAATCAATNVVGTGYDLPGRSPTAPPRFSMPFPRLVEVFIVLIK
jgi:hypothetical protein